VEKKIKKTSARFDLIVTAGGASVGDEDHLIKVINKIGKIFFWKAAIKPGRPIAFGKVNKCFILCLPGNPVSVQLLYALLVKPFIFYLSGSDILLPKAEKIKVNFKMQKKTNRMEWLRVIKKKKNFDFVAEKYNKQGSGMISSMAYSDGIIEIPEEVKKIEYGQIYDYYDFKMLFP
jgi:molybdopterin molybdotransferase